MSQDSTSPFFPYPSLDIPCRVCEYSLNGLTTARCPECGSSFDPKETFIEAVEYFYPTRRKLLECFFPESQFPQRQQTLIQLAQHPQASFMFSIGMICQQEILQRYGDSGLPSHWEVMISGLSSSSMHRFMEEQYPRAPRAVFRDFPLPEGEARCSSCRKRLPELKHGSCPHCGTTLNPGDMAPDSILEKIPLRKEDTPMLIHMALAAEGIPSMYGSAGHWSDILTGGGVIAAAGVIRVPRDYYLDAINYVLRHRSEFEASEADLEPNEDEWCCPECNEPNPSSFDVCWNCNSSRS